MTRPQRRLHALAWLVLGPVALATIALAIALRPPLPGPAPSPSVHSPSAEATR